MKTLVTGHRGFIGSYLTKHLEDYIGMDILDGNNILHADLPKVDLVIHLAAQPGVIRSMQDPMGTFQTNLLGTVRLANHYKDTPFIFASTGGAIQERIESPYGLSKLAAEDYLKMTCSKAVILRFANVYGKKSRSVVDKFINDRVTIYGDGSATRTYVFIDDLIRGILQARSWEPGSYYFGTDQNYTVQQLAEATGKPITYADWRKGELKYSSLKNTTPDWQSTVDVLDYIKSHV